MSEEQDTRDAEVMIHYGSISKPGSWRVGYGSVDRARRIAHRAVDLMADAELAKRADPEPPHHPGMSYPEPPAPEVETLRAVLVAARRFAVEYQTGLVQKGTWTSLLAALGAAGEPKVASR